MGKSLNTKIIYISEEKPSMYGKPYHDIKLASGHICHYENDVSEFQIGDKVEVVENSKHDGSTVYPNRFCNLSLIERQTSKSIDEVLKHTEIESV